MTPRAALLLGLVCALGFLATCNAVPTDMSCEEMCKLGLISFNLDKDNCGCGSVLGEGDKCVSECVKLDKENGETWSHGACAKACNVIKKTCVIAKKETSLCNKDKCVPACNQWKNLARRAVDRKKRVAVQSEAAVQP